jgi:hypothetical protein
MSTPKSFLLPYVAHVHRLCTIDPMIGAWVECEKRNNAAISDTAAIQSFLDYYGLNDELSVQWGTSCLQRFRECKRQNGGKI